MVPENNFQILTKSKKKKIPVRLLNIKKLARPIPLDMVKCKYIYVFRINFINFVNTKIPTINMRICTMYIMHIYINYVHMDDVIIIMICTYLCNELPEPGQHTSNTQTFTRPTSTSKPNTNIILRSNIKVQYLYFLDWQTRLERLHPTPSIRMSKDKLWNQKFLSHKKIFSDSH